MNGAPSRMADIRRVGAQVPVADFVRCIFSHVRSISGDLFALSRTLSKLRGVTPEFLHILGRLLPLPRYELVAAVRRSLILGVKLYFSFTSLREPGFGLQCQTLSRQAIFLAGISG